jgi:hypothetical protein
MFFRREKPRQVTFEERLQKLRESGFAVESLGSGKARVSRSGFAAMLEDKGTDAPLVGRAGVVVGNEIGYMVHGGFQMFFVTPSGRKLPALAEHLRALHDFQEDLRESLGLISLYNTSLGTIADRHLYDRVEDRDAGARKLPVRMMAMPTKS